MVLITENANAELWAGNVTQPVKKIEITFSLSCCLLFGSFLWVRINFSYSNKGMVAAVGSELEKVSFCKEMGLESLGIHLYDVETESMYVQYVQGI